MVQEVFASRKTHHRRDFFFAFLLAAAPKDRRAGEAPSAALGAGDLGERIFSKGKGGAGVDFLPVLLYTSFAVANHSQLESGN